MIRGEVIPHAPLQAWAATVAQELSHEPGNSPQPTGVRAVVGELARPLGNSPHITPGGHVLGRGSRVPLVRVPEVLACTPEIVARAPCASSRGGA
ncbi:hypothetical protein [Thermobaculum terrenum]|uniref:hypothetical protein n=1 Tax=Thermobaculum terrenum TaxID=166501 RepID=UPI00019BEBD7|nr:hypothetical protein [Thermobaculum terrenum]